MLVVHVKVTQCFNDKNASKNGKAGETAAATKPQDFRYKLKKLFKKKINLIIYIIAYKIKSKIKI